MITAIVLARNEENSIQRCLDSLKWCSEIILIDDNSIDRTVSLAKKNNIKVITRRLKTFSDQRNYALSIAKYEWVLFLDADEIISEKLKNEIIDNLKSNKEISGFFIKRIDNIWDNKINYGDGLGMSFLRLGKKNAGKWSGDVHEIWQVTGKKESLENPIEHFPHPTIAEFLSEINLYSSIRADELYRKGKTVNIIEIVLYTVGKFVDNYIFKLGVQDGIVGLIRALMMSFYSFLTRSKLYFLWQKNPKK